MVITTRQGQRQSLAHLRMFAFNEQWNVRLSERRISAAVEIERCGQCNGVTGVLILLAVLAADHSFERTGRKIQQRPPQHTLPVHDPRDKLSKARAVRCSQGLQELRRARCARRERIQGSGGI